MTPPRQARNAANCPTSQSPQLCRHRRRAAAGRRLGQRDQVRRLPSAGLDRPRQGPACSPATATTGPTGCPPSPRRSAKLNVDTALLDGELVALDKDGISSFPALQAALSAGRDATLYLLSVRSAAPGRLGPARLRAARPQARAARPGRLAGHAALQRSPRRRRRRHAPARPAR